jgi:phosphate transport system substrate-binding protein
LNYQSIGSGGGIKQIQNKTVTFGASDMPLTAEDVTKNGFVQFPVINGAVVPAITLPGIKPGELTLDGPTLANIYLGKITKWNDPAIAKLNPNAKLPATAIVVVHRSDGSGTTFIWTDYLSKISPEWKDKVGESTAVEWPVGIGAKGNEGVANMTAQTDGAIGYVEQAYALQNNMTVASVKNKSGTYIAPTIAATSAAAVGIKVPANLAISTINSPNPAAYPIVSQTFLIGYVDACKAGITQSAAAGVKKFLTYAVGPGQQTLGAGGSQLPYAPLPAALAAKDTAQLSTLVCNGAPLT